MVSVFLPLLNTANAFAGSIPEPDLILYGQIKLTANQRLTTGTLIWQFRSATRTVIVSTSITNINDQFSYLLRVPCETEVGSFIASSNVIRLISAPTSYDRSQVVIITDSPSPAIFLNPAQTNLSIASADRGQIERIDLMASGPCPDTDGNGLPDCWEKQYFGRIGIDPNDDFDHDGLTNFQEYKAGTNPADPNSQFEFVNVIPQQPSGIRVEWSSVEGTRYTLQRTSDLASNPAATAWTTIQTHIPARFNDLKTSLLDSTATGAGPYFYRLQVEP